MTGRGNGPKVAPTGVQVAVFAWEWARALAGTSWVAADRTEVADLLRGLTMELADALERDPFNPAAGVPVGEALVTAGFAAPDALARTLPLLTERLLADLGLAARIDAPLWRGRMSRLAGMVSLGFVRAVRDRTLDQQEAIRASVLVARQRAVPSDVLDAALADDLPRAIERGDVVAHYQPILSPWSGRIEAVEALARWPHPRQGVVMPSRFLTLAERRGVMGGLGRAMLRQACAQATTWAAATAPTTTPPLVSVNLAPSQVADHGTVGDVAGVLEATGLPPERLQLEISEDAALGAAATLGVVKELAGLGVVMAIDDFGTGQAHLAQLADLAAHGVHTLKLPADFLVGLGPSAAPRADRRVRLLGALMDLAHDLDLRVVAEGVETAGQARVVRQLGADLVQGLYYAPPVAAGELDLGPVPVGGLR